MNGYQGCKGGDTVLCSVFFSALFLPTPFQAPPLCLLITHICFINPYLCRGKFAECACFSANTLWPLEAFRAVAFIGDRRNLFSFLKMWSPIF